MVPRPEVKDAIVECNTAYPGERNTAKDHMKVAEEHGFTSFAEVDIMDAEGEMKIPVRRGRHLKYDLLGSHFDNYDALVSRAEQNGIQIAFENTEGETE